MLVVSPFQSSSGIWARVVTQLVWLGCVMDTQGSIWYWIFQPNIIIQWSCRKIFFCSVILEKLFCGSCGGMVLYRKRNGALLWTRLLSAVLEYCRCGLLGLSKLSLSELLNTKQWHTGLWDLGGE